MKLELIHAGSVKRNPVVRVSDENGSTDWTRQPSAGWTTMTGWPAAPEFATQLDEFLAQDEEAGAYA